MQRIKPSPLIAALACLLVLVVTAGLYAQGLNGGFLFDDFPNIVDNSDVQPHEVSVANLANAALSSPSSEFKRPLASLSFALNVIASDGLDPVAMKVTNIVIHLANGALLFVLMGNLLACLHGGRKPGHFATALLVAAAWLLLPINLTAVLYVVQRMESMANLFVLAGLLGYVAARRRMLEGKAGFAFAVGSILLGTAIGVLAKETAVLLPLYSLLLEVFLFHGQSLRPDSVVPARDKRITVFYVLTLLLPIAVGILWLAPRTLDPATWMGRDFTLSMRLWSEARIVIDYIAWTLIPTASNLAFYHDDFVASTGPLSPWTTLPSALGIAGLAVAAFALRRRLPLAGLGLSWYLACHTLTGTVLPLELIYEHRNYFASIGLVILVVCLCRGESGVPGSASASPRFALVRTTVLVALFAWWAALLGITARAWDSPLTMAQELAWRGPGSPRAQYELGRTYIILSRYQASSPFVALAYPPLERAMRIPGSSILPEQALIFLNSKMGRDVKDDWWKSMQAKLLSRQPTVQDESSLDALTKCQASKACAFPSDRLLDMYLAAMSHPRPSARLLAMYADFAWTNLGDRPLGLAMQARAVAASPGETAYRITLATMAIGEGRQAEAKAQLAAIRSANTGGRFNADILRLQREMQAGGEAH